jgi:hypothetical protein
MQANAPDEPTTKVIHLTTREVASRLRVHQRTVERWRRMNMGPPFLKIMGRVLYRLEDVETYEASGLHPAGRS